MLGGAIIGDRPLQFFLSILFRNRRSRRDNFCCIVSFTRKPLVVWCCLFLNTQETPEKPRGFRLFLPQQKTGTLV
jgi:hypothetical protein